MTATPPALTPREIQVLKRMVEGQSSKEIGLGLNVTEVTVKIHRKAMMRKAGARNAPHLIAIAFRTGLVR